MSPPSGLIHNEAKAALGELDQQPEDVVDQVVGQVHGEQLRLRRKRARLQFLCNGRRQKLV